MKIGILSDTHNKLAGVDNALKIFAAQQVNLVLHCGDWSVPATVTYVANQLKLHGLKLQGVLGNNDVDISGINAACAGYSNFKLTTGVLKLNCGNKRVAVYHGHHLPTLRLVLAGLSSSYDVLFLGHSHKPRFDKISDKYIINPGSTAFSIPRVKGFRGSVVIYNTATHAVEFIYFDT